MNRAAVPPGSEDLTHILEEWQSGDSSALDRLLPVVYEQLRQIAERHLRRERGDHTLQPTALVHEAFLKLIGQRVSWQNRAHFFAVSAEIMRRILVDHARKKQADKRGGSAPTISLDERIDWSDERDVNLVALDDALQELATVDPQQSKVVELRFFGGLSVEETAEVMNISTSTVKREWRMARAWLLSELESPAGA